MMIRNALLVLGLVAFPAVGFAPSSSTGSSSTTALSMSSIIKAEDAKKFLDPLGIIKKKPSPPYEATHEPDPSLLPKRVDVFQDYAPRSPCDIPFEYYESTPPGKPKRAKLGEVLERGQWEY
eukprot:CAMPEP_0202491714 /NCGR_PEP_ID=MMETSP1361-20130828/8681_1 /ASSEMBLY_ACC=CAM_ASM_000849 /TAXON_ID=210615 /ORGANISM="Staurosira complex sp., Strain CCMP2646" /LENGTH=121 /DNA_ID=CAMNT_0049121811 /DNA_START=42 /DNA_END=407 /DNA_ORIENTATION=+